MPTLNWMGKEKVVMHHRDVPFHFLKKKYTFNSDISENMIIHSDNLLALKALLPKYGGKIDCIYIDPPYNTGNTPENGGWVYNDNVSDPHIKKWLGEVVGKEGEDFSRHDKWLCMMYPRLKLLYELLSPKGVIFISIDDNEQANLKLLMDEIFGRSNFVATSVIITNRGGRDYGGIAKQHEYICIYTKTDNGEIGLVEEKNKDFKYCDELGGFDLMELRNRNVRFNDSNRPNLFYPFFLNPKKKDNNGLYEISLEMKDGYIPVYPAKSNGIQTVWRWGKEEKARANLNKIIFGKENKNGGYMIVQKTRRTVRMQRSVWDEKEFVNERGTEVLKEMFSDNSFDYPKSKDLIKRIIEIGSSPNSIILDSFAGSGTTAHAVLDLNKQDGGKRKFILVEMCDYAESITSERVKRVIKGYGNGTKAQEGTGGDFAYYELGEALYSEDGSLNKNATFDDLKEYIWYTETSSSFNKCDAKNHSKYYLGEYAGMKYYFIYEKDKSTSFDNDFIYSINTPLENAVVYADKCLFSSAFLEEHNLIFKKIPRDIKRV